MNTTTPERLTSATEPIAAALPIQPTPPRRISFKDSFYIPEINTPARPGADDHFNHKSRGWI